MSPGCTSEEHALWMNPADALAAQITDAEPVQVSSARGSLRIKVRLTNDIMPGVVCLLEGVWLELEPDGSDGAGSANMLTSTAGTLPVTPAQPIVYR